MAETAGGYIAFRNITHITVQLLGGVGNVEKRKLPKFRAFGKRNTEM
jgi:hypothetical protein